ncbi:lysosomal alpha-glucosidase [Elysia marginata]|uniref:Lysosomal alpha-glucosidase n=1 Tax=Elysia marginata TaxID=1093978 RepID=A0AAV4HPS7_9GAST|nr:lysosomal alpha-glucosidase [Elysia marginata]
MAILTIWSDKKSGPTYFPEVCYQEVGQDPEKIVTDKRKAKSKLLEKASFVLLCLITLFIGLIMVLFGMKVLSDMRNNPSDSQVTAISDMPNKPIKNWMTKVSGSCAVADNNRFDCWPEYIGATQDKCQARGCCWQPATTPGSPYCFFPPDYNGYTASNVKTTASGVSADLTRTTTTLFPPDIKTLKLQIDFQTESRLRVKIFDPANARFEPPVEVPKGAKAVSNPQYKVKVTESPFNIVITRASTGATVFDTTGMAPFIFADQYLQIGTRLSSQYLYGLGEHRYGFLQDINKWRKLVFWNRDDIPKVDNNGYGSHPFYLNLEPNMGKNGVPQAHGVLLLNSNAGDVAMQPYGQDRAGALTFRFTGGLIDMFVLLGDSPLSVGQLYTQVVGAPYMPPFWSLGFHLCRWGYNSSDGLTSVIKRNRDANIPYDVQWNDIDYMDKYKDWTYSPDNFGNLPSIIADLHANKQRYIIMADPAISSSQPAGSYPPFDDGKRLDTFVKTENGDILVGKVWPGETAFPDFFHPNAYTYWYTQAKQFHDKIAFDGLWIDMNEPSSFIDGSATGCSQTSKYNHPPYTPGTIDGGSLVQKTICPSAQHYLSAHYNLHNMYGWSQANITRAALNTIYGNKRSPIISRSTFVGSGRYTGHWLGDNDSNYKDMAYSIPGILNFNLFGIPLIGADICGFRGTTTPEMCTRWHQLGVFYPFMRNHADIRSPDQDPASFPSPYVAHIRKALNLRYQLLAVLYTGFFNANTKGLPIVRPLFYIYPGTEAISNQFMWNDQLLISPVLTQGASTVNAFIPRDRFYDYYTLSPVNGGGRVVSLPAPLDTINVHIRGGSILPLLPTTTRTDDARQQKFTITAASSLNGTAQGELFWDDGESSNSIPSKMYSLIKFNLNKNILTTTAAMKGYMPTSGLQAGVVYILGVPQAPNTVLVNGNTEKFFYVQGSQILKIDELSLDLLQANTITWK